MRDGLSELAGEVARLRSQANHLLSLLDWLDQLANGREFLPPDGHLQIVDVSKRYGQTAADHLEYAGGALREWYAAAERIKNEMRAYGERYKGNL